METIKIQRVVDELVNNMEALNESSPIMIGVVGIMASKFVDAHRKFLEKHGEISSQDGDHTIYAIPMEMRSRVKKLRKHSEDLSKSLNLIPKNLLVSFVSEFDCFLGSLLKVIYSKRPELLNDSDRQIKYSDLLAFGSIDEAKEQILEKEVESILRKSHSDHFTILEKKFDIKLRKGLDIWKDFIELTERRNLLVHANGIVSNQYLKVCREHSVDVSGLKIGDHLVIDKEYLRNSSKVIFEISIKLASVLWRKLFPDEREDADKYLNSLCLDLIGKGNNQLASRLLEFAIDLPKHHSETIKRMMIINLAQAYRRSGREPESEQIIKRYDWSATGCQFKLAVSVLKGKNNESAKLLKRAFHAGDLNEHQIIDWPLFSEFRKTDEFLKAFKELFDKDYAQQEEAIKQKFETHMNSVFSYDEENPLPIDTYENVESIDNTSQKVEKEIDIELDAKIEK